MMILATSIETTSSLIESVAAKWRRERWLPLETNNGD
jgi:hypothetical protein